MKRVRRYLEKLLNEDLVELTKVGVKVSQHRRKSDIVEYKALKSAFMVRVSEGSLEQIRSMMASYDRSIESWRTIIVDPDISTMPDEKIHLLQTVKRVVLDSKIEEILSKIDSIPAAKEALVLAISVYDEVEQLLNTNVPVY